MRSRVAWVAGLCCFVVAGCGSDNPIRPLLGGQGIGNIRFGQTPDRVATGIERLFGHPSSASPGRPNNGLFHWGCGFDEMIWAGLAARSDGANSDGLTMYFKHSRLVGYSYGPPYGGPRASAVHDGLMLSTSRGLGLDEPLARGRRLYGRAFVMSSQAQGTPPISQGPRLPVWQVSGAHGRIYGYIDSTPPLSRFHRIIGSISAGAIPNTPCR
jgi:hypothetical protein